MSCRRAELCFARMIANVKGGPKESASTTMLVIRRLPPPCKQAEYQAVLGCVLDDDGGLI